MQVEDYKMTGPELNELYERVKRTHKSVQAFADYIGVGRTALYTAFKMDQIPPDIDEALDKRPELLQVKNKILKGSTEDADKKHPAESEAGKGGPSKAVLSDVLQNVTKMSAELAETNRYFREVVQMAQAAGAIKFTFDQSKAITVSQK